MPGRLESSNSTEPAGGLSVANPTRRSGKTLPINLVVADRRGGVEAGADAANRIDQASAETVRRGTQELAESQRQIVQNAAQQLEAVSRKVAEAIQGTQEDVRSLMTLPSAARGGLQDWQQGVTGLIQGVARTNLQATQELLRLANPGAFVELQQRFVRQYLDTVIENSVTLVRAVRRTADETLGRSPGVSAGGRINPTRDKTCPDRG
jgi:hypothetical protein